MNRLSHRFASIALALPLMACATSSTGQSPVGVSEPAGVHEELVLLGTGGGPIARIGRGQPGNLLQVGERTYLIDIGSGTPRQIVHTGRRLNVVDAVFISHLHFDHTAGIMGFMALDWQDRRAEPVHFYGPPGTRELVDNTMLALGSGEAIFRPQLPDLPAMNSVFFGVDFDVTLPREVYRDEAVTVTAVENSHYGTMHTEPTTHRVDRAYSYRFETPGRSIVFTGDTGPSPAVEELARDVDVLVSEIIDIDALEASLARRAAVTGIDQAPLIGHMKEEHLTPENVGRLAAASRAKMVVLTHFATPPGIETFDEDAIRAAIRLHYAGPVHFGQDLLSY